jgi:hypothetical protein
MTKKFAKGKLLQGARVYLSGPMDFVASRANEKKYGWRTRVGEFLHALGVVVFDPWMKPEVRGLHDYGREGVDTSDIREKWTFEQSPSAAKTRAAITGHFWETLHIDLRMVDTSDFIVAYCPTSIYSVGTPHEIALCRSQRKPVLFVSPPIQFPTLAMLKEYLSQDPKGTQMLDEFIAESGIKENPQGSPSLWYMPLVGGESFFDGFGFSLYNHYFKWKRIPLDDHEDHYEIKNPLLPYLEKLSQQLPMKWDNKFNRFTRNDDWLLWDLKEKGAGALIETTINEQTSKKKK